MPVKAFISAEDDKKGSDCVSEDDSECVQRKRLKRIEADIIKLEKRIESLEGAEKKE